MRFRQVLLVMVVILFASRNTFASPSDSRKLPITIGHHDEDNHNRLLRVGKSNAEERGVLSSIKSWAKSTYWAFNGKPEAEVKAKLGLTGLSDAAMKASPNYKTYQKYLYNIEGYKLDAWADSKRYSPPLVWENLKLNRMSEVERKGSQELKTYKRFVKRFESNVYHAGYPAFIPDTEPEISVLLSVWAKAKRDESYVKKMLDIDEGRRHFSVVTHRWQTSWKSEKEIANNPNYKYLQQFRNERHKW